MSCAIPDDHHPRDRTVVSFNTIGNNSISHHIPIPGLSPGSPRWTPSRTPIRKRIALKEEKDPTVVAIDGYTIHTDDDDVKTNSGKLSFMEWYSNQLESHPVRTKSLTAGSLAVIGDVLAQIIEFGSDLRESDILFDRRRIFAMFIEGSCVSGPMLHFVFEFYEYICPIHCIDDCAHKDNEAISNESLENDISVDGDRLAMVSQSHNAFEVSKRQYLAALLHVAFDQIVMAFPYVAGMMCVTALVEGHGSGLAEELEEEFMNNVRASWYAALGLAPFQFFAFRYLPITWRVLAVNLQDIIWVMVMSYVTHRTRETSEPFFDFSTDDFANHDDLFSVHYHDDATADAGEY